MMAAVQALRIRLGETVVGLAAARREAVQIADARERLGAPEHRGLDVLERAGFRAILAVRRTEFVWAVAALVGVVALGTLKGILAAIVMSLVALAALLNWLPGLTVTVAMALITLTIGNAASEYLAALCESRGSRTVL